MYFCSIRICSLKLIFVVSLKKSQMVIKISDLALDQKQTHTPRNDKQKSSLHGTTQRLCDKAYRLIIHIFICILCLYYSFEIIIYCVMCTSIHI